MSESQVVPELSSESTADTSEQFQLHRGPSSQKKFLVIILIAVLAIAVASLFFTAKQNSTSDSLSAERNPSPLATTEPNPATQVAIESSVISELLALLASSGYKRIETDTLWWISEDNWSILVQDAESIAIVNPQAHAQLQDPTTAAAQQVALIAQHFLSRGFKKSPQNSSNDVLDTQFYDYIIGYQKGDERCLLTVNPDEGFSMNRQNERVNIPNIIVSCSTAFQKSYDAQTPFLRAKNDPTAVVKIGKQNDVAAVGSVGWRRTGALALFSKINGEWKLIFEGHEVPTCELLQRYSFPAEIYSDCYSAESQ